MTPADVARAERRLTRIRVAFREFGTRMPGVTPEEVAFAAVAAAADLAALAIDTKAELGPKLASCYIGLAQTLMPGCISVETVTLPTPDGPVH